MPEVLQDGTSTYVYGHGLVSQTDGSGTQTYLLADGLGSTRTASGAFVWDYNERLVVQTEPVLERPAAPPARLPN